MSLLVNEADLYIVDEPTNGLDINGVAWLKGVFSKFRKEGKTLIVTSHAIKELEDGLSHYAILSGGSIKAQGSLAELESDMIMIKVDDNQKLFNFLMGKYNASLTGDYVLVDEEIDKQELLTLLVNNGFTPQEFRKQKRSLIDIFNAIEGKSNE